MTFTISLCPLTDFRDATRKLLDIGEAVTEKWNTEIIWGSTWNVNGLQKVAVAKTTKGSHYDAISVMAPTLTVAEQFYSSNGVPSPKIKETFGRKTTQIGMISLSFLMKEIISIISKSVKKRRIFTSTESHAFMLTYHSIVEHGTATVMPVMNRKIWLSINFALKKFLVVLLPKTIHILDNLNKKVCSYKTSVTDNGLSTERYAFPIIRLADLYLMYAEALNETLNTPNNDVYTYIDLVRERAGLDGVKESWQKYSKYPEKPNTKTGMREIIRMERLNELACEGKRFWDLRRWKKELPREVKGWYVQGETAQEFYRVTTLYLRSRYSFKDYLWPLKVETVLKDPNLGQNPGW